MIKWRFKAQTINWQQFTFQVLLRITFKGERGSHGISLSTFQTASPPTHRPPLITIPARQEALCSDHKLELCSHRLLNPNTKYLPNVLQRTRSKFQRTNLIKGDSSETFCFTLRAEVPRGFVKAL